MDTQTTAPQTPADRAGTVGNETKQATRDVAATAGHEAQRVTRESKDQVRRLVGQTRSELQSQAATQQGRAASGLRELADQLRSMADSTDQDSTARGLVDDVARRAGDAATWLDARDPGSILEEARTFARRRPGTFLAIAAGVGVVAGRLSRGLVDEARDESSGSTGNRSSTGQSYVGGTGYAGSSGYETTAGGYGTGSLAGTGVGDAGMPTATSPTAGTTSSLPTSTGGAPGAVESGMATVPSGDLPGPHGSTQPITPAGDPMPIGSDGHLTAEGDDAIGRSER